MNNTFFLSWQPSGLLLTDYLLFTVYVMVFGLFTWRMWKTGAGASKKLLLIALSVFVQQCILGLLHNHTVIFPDMPDVDNYANWIFGHQYPRGMSAGVVSMYYMGFVLAPLCLYRPILLCVFNAFVFQVVLLLFWISFRAIASRCERGAVESTITPMVFLGLVFCWPAAVLYVPTILREAWVLLSFAIFVFGCLHWIANTHLKHFFLAALGVLLLVVFRPLLALPAMLILFIAGVNKTPAHSLLKLLFIIATTAGVLFATAAILQLHIDPVSLAERRNLSVENPIFNGMTYGHVNWQSWWNVVASVPAMIIQFLIAPFPVLTGHMPFKMKFASADAFYCATVIMLFLWFLFNKVASGKFAWMLLLAIAFIFLVMMAFYEYHLSGAVRHRMPVILLVLPFVSAGLAGRGLKFIAFAKN